MTWFHPPWAEGGNSNATTAWMTTDRVAEVTASMELSRMYTDKIRDFRRRNVELGKYSIMHNDVMKDKGQQQRMNKRR